MDTSASRQRSKEWRGTLIEEELAFPKTKFANGCALLDDFGMQVIGG
jgi:hypothetical protein